MCHLLFNCLMSWWNNVFILFVYALWNRGAFSFLVPSNLRVCTWLYGLWLILGFPVQVYLENIIIDTVLVLLGDIYVTFMKAFSSVCVSLPPEGILLYYKSNGIKHFRTYSYWKIINFGAITVIMLGNTPQYTTTLLIIFRQQHSCIPYSATMDEFYRYLCVNCRHNS